jgi:AcrR family transcriptional regulator
MSSAAKRTGKRRYVSPLRNQAASTTKASVLQAARTLFTRSGIDRVTIVQIAHNADVAVSTVYALFKSKEGILRALMSAALFGRAYKAAELQLEGEADPIKLLELTAAVARAIYEGESAELGLMRGASAFSPALRKLEREFERMRFEMQEGRVRLLFAQSWQRKGLSMEEARRILWMYTSRDIYRMLVQESGWTPDRYQAWVAETLVRTLARTGRGR